MSKNSKGRHFKDDSKTKHHRGQGASAHGSRRERKQQETEDQDATTTTGARFDEDDAGLDHMATTIESAPSDDWDDPFDVMPDLSEDEWYNEGGAEEPEPTPKKKHHHVLAFVLVVVLALAAVAGVGGYALYQSAQNVATSARSAMATTSDFVSSLQHGNTAVLKSDAESFANYVSAMKNETASPLWTVAAKLPAVGGDVTRVITLVDVMQDLSDGVMTPAADAMDGVSMDSLLADKSIDVDTLTTLCNTLTEVQPEIAQAASTVDALGDADTEQLQEPLSDAREKLDEVNRIATDVAQIGPQLPAMLGSEKAQNYLVVVQNNSEIRSTGGSPDSYAVVTIDNGQISLGGFGVASESTGKEAIPLTDEESNVTVSIMETDADKALSDVNAVPSFPRAAQLMAGCLEKESGQQVDGVIAVDPVFLQSLLGLTGGVTTSDGTKVDGTNAAQILLNQTYYLADNEQDPFYAQVAGLALNTILSNMGNVSLSGIESAIAQGMHEGRFLVYMDDADAESAIAEIGAAGEVNQDATHPVTGFYVSDKTGAKLDWYLDMRSTVSEPTINADSSKSYTVTVTLGNTTTLDQMKDELPAAITGSTPEDHDYSMVTAFCIMAPAGGTISNLNIDASQVDKQEEATLYGNDVWAGYVDTNPSTTSTFTYTVTVSPEAESDLTVWTTPTAQTFA